MVCPKCGAASADDSLFCTACGADLKTRNREIAGFWQRVGASVIDSLVLFPVGIVLAKFGFGAAGSSYYQLRASGAMITLLAGVCYRFLLEASVWQGTIGKRLVGLQVTDLAGARLSLRQSLKREGCRQLIEFTNIAAILLDSFGTLTILGLASLALQIVDLAWMSRTPKLQTLHDQMAGTLVYHKITATQANSPQFPSIS